MLDMIDALCFIYCNLLSIHSIILLLELYTMIHLAYCSRGELKRRHSIPRRPHVSVPTSIRDYFEVFNFESPALLPKEKSKARLVHSFQRCKYAFKGLPFGIQRNFLH